MRSTALLLGLALSLTAVPAVAQDAQPASNLTLAKLVAVRNLRCDALQRGEQARLAADVHRASLTGASGVTRINAESQISQSEAEAGAAFEEAGNLKRRLGTMLERYVADHRLKWYQTPDEAERVRIEDLIGGAREIVAEECD